MNQAWECFKVALRLGLTSFGGPVAHIGYFRETYVEKKQWLSEERFGELTSLTQFIPGPGSSQLGAAIGYERGGLSGGFAAWVGFTLPSAVVMTLIALGLGDLSGDRADGLLKGLQLAALAVVLNAFVGMRQSLAPDLRRILIAVAAFVVLWLSSAAWMTLVVIAVSAMAAQVLLPGESERKIEAQKGKGVLGWVALGVFAVLLIGSLGQTTILAGIYRAGALVFGGGHVVLPMLRETMVLDGEMSDEVFLAGYGATQAMPGPVFTFAAFLGGRSDLFGSPWLASGAALIAVFLPGMLLLGGTLKIWDGLRGKGWAQQAVKGANAAVVGVLGVALAQMAAGRSVGGWQDALVVLGLFWMLRKKTLPAWGLVFLAAGGGWLLAY